MIENLAAAAILLAAVALVALSLDFFLSFHPHL